MSCGGDSTVRDSQRCDAGVSDFSFADLPQSTWNDTSKTLVAPAIDAGGALDPATCPQFDEFGNPMSSAIQKCGVITRFEMRALGPGAVLRPTGKTSSESEMRAGYQVAWTMIRESGEAQDYAVAAQKLGMARKIFLQFDFQQEANACHLKLIQIAERIGPAGEAAFQRGIAAMAAGKIDEVDRQLAQIPHGFEGREVLSAFVENARTEKKLLSTYAVAAAVVEAHKLNMQEAENGFWEGVFGYDTKPQQAALTQLMTSWEARLQGGQFRTTREILQDIWDKGTETDRAAIAMMGGHENAMNDDEDVKAMLAGPLAGALGHNGVPHFTIREMLAQEEHPDPEALTQRLAIMLTNSSGPAGNEVAAAAMIYRLFPAYASQDAQLAEYSKGGANPLVGMTEKMALMVTGAAAAELTTVAIMARLAPQGVEGLSLAGRIGVEAGGMTINAGAFTLYERLLTQFAENKKVDWSAKAVSRDWATMAITFGFARGMQLKVIEPLRGKMGNMAAFADAAGTLENVGGRMLPALNGTGRVLFGVSENLLTTAGFLGGGKASYTLDLRDTPPTFFQEWLSLMQFKTAHGFANHATGGWVNQKAYEIRTKPLFEVTQRLSLALERNRADKGEAWTPEDREAVADALFLAHARGQVSASQLAAMEKGIERGNLDSIDAVVKVNSVLKSAGLNLVYDGTRFHAATAEAREAYVAEVKAQKTVHDPLRTLTPEPVYAMCGEGEVRPMAPADSVVSEQGAEANASSPGGGLADVVIDALRAQGRQVETDHEIFDTNLQFRERRKQVSAPVSADAYSPLDRTLIVVTGEPGKELSLQTMEKVEAEHFQEEARRRGYATTNLRRNGDTRTEAQTVEYHLIGSSIDPATIEFLKMVTPHVRIMRYDSADAVSKGQGAVVYDTARQYRLSELAQEGEVRVQGDAVSVYRGDALVRRYPTSQVTNEFYHYEGRLDGQKAREVKAWTQMHGKDLSQMTLHEGLQLLQFLGNRDWKMRDMQGLIGVEGMKQIFECGSAMPFGFEDALHFAGFRQAFTQVLDQGGFGVYEGEVALFVIGSSVGGYTSKGGEFRWDAKRGPFGEAIEPSDVDAWLRVSPRLAEALLRESSMRTAPNVKKARELEDLRRKLGAAEDPGRRRQLEKRMAEVESWPDEVGLSDSETKKLRKRVVEEGFFLFEDLPPRVQDAIGQVMKRFPQLRDMAGLVQVEGGIWDRNVMGGIQGEKGDSIFDTPILQWNLYGDPAPEFLENN